MRPKGATLDREAVISEAMSLTLQKGYRGYQWKDLAAALNIKPPSLYNHVRDLEEVQIEVTYRCLDRLAQYLELHLSKAQPEHRFETMLTAFRGFVRKYPHFYDATVQSHYGSRSYREKSSKVLEIILSAMGLTEGEATVHRVRLVRSLLHGFIELERRGGFGRPEEIQKTFRLLIQAAEMILEMDAG